MTIDLFLNLIDRVIQLGKYKQERSEKLLSSFIEPIFLEFESIHKQYLTSFKTYRELIGDATSSIKPVIEKIKEDRLFSEGHRLKIYALSDISGNKLVKISNNNLIDDFIFGIFEYLTNPDDFVAICDGHKIRELNYVKRGARWPVQSFRSSFIEALEVYSRQRTKDQIEHEINGLTKWELNERLFRYCNYAHWYKKLFPAELKQHIANTHGYFDLKERVESLNIDSAKKILTTIERNNTPDIEDLKTKAINKLDVMVEQMQAIYGEVSANYFKLRQDLLTKYG